MTSDKYKLQYLKLKTAEQIFSVAEKKYARGEMPFVLYEAYTKVLYESFDCLPRDLRRLCDEWNIEVLQMLEFLGKGVTTQQIINTFNAQKNNISPPVVDNRKPKP